MQVSPRYSGRYHVGRVLQRDLVHEEHEEEPEVDPLLACVEQAPVGSSIGSQSRQLSCLEAGDCLVLEQNYLMMLVDPASGGVKQPYPRGEV